MVVLNRTGTDQASVGSDSDVLADQLQDIQNYAGQMVNKNLKMQQEISALKAEIEKLHTEIQQLKQTENSAKGKVANILRTIKESL